jgi:hypothetical protein
LEVVTVVVQPNGGKTPAAARQAVPVIVDDAAPAAVTVLAMLMVQFTSKPAPVGKAGGSHCAAAGAVAAADAAGTPITPPISARLANVITAPPIATRHRRSSDEAAGINDSFVNPEINNRTADVREELKQYTRNIKPAREFPSVLLACWRGYVNFLSNHGQALLCLARDPRMRLRDVADCLGITERRTYAIVFELTEAGYVIKEKEGRRNRYEVQEHLPIPDGLVHEQAIGELLGMLNGRRDPESDDP